MSGHSKPGTLRTTVTTHTGDVFKLDGEDWKGSEASKPLSKKPAYDPEEYVGQMKSGSEELRREGSVKSQWYSVINPSTRKAEWVEERAIEPVIGYDIGKSAFSPHEVLRLYTEATNEAFLRHYVSYMMMKRETGGYVLRWNGHRLYNTDGTPFRLNTRFPNQALADFTKGWPKDIAFDGVLYIPYENEFHYHYIKDEMKALWMRLNKYGKDRSGKWVSGSGGKPFELSTNAAISAGIASVEKARKNLREAAPKQKGEGETAYQARMKTPRELLVKAEEELQTVLETQAATMFSEDDADTGARYMDYAMRRFKNPDKNERVRNVQINLVESYMKIRAYIKAVGFTSLPTKVPRWPDMSKTLEETKAMRDVVDYYHDSIHKEIRDMAAALTDDTDRQKHDLAWSMAKFQVLDLWSTASDEPFVQRYDILRKRIAPLQERAFLIYRELPDTDAFAADQDWGDRDLNDLDSADANYLAEFASERDLVHKSLATRAGASLFDADRLARKVNIDPHDPLAAKADLAKKAAFEAAAKRFDLDFDEFVPAGHSKAYVRDIVDLKDRKYLPRIDVQVVLKPSNGNTTLEIAPAAYINSVEHAMTAISGALRHQTVTITDPEDTRDDATMEKKKGVPDELGPVDQERAKLLSGILLGFKTGEKVGDQYLGKLKYFLVQSVKDGEIKVEIPDGSLDKDVRLKPKEYFPTYPEGITIIYYTRKIEGDEDNGEPQGWLLDSIEYT
ncbi:hypothetical protein JKP88DRAFT_273056 [Tribonema minus]|uniref:Uncharacterized protein n=1 Tax=Tribonema minus TaxID=303371 RepID=A0A836CEW2_9STRA|nr:hypothetical protein JKP88DRAFT_273056 [Tribonema minus]